MKKDYPLLVRRFRDGHDDGGVGSLSDFFNIERKGKLMKLPEITTAIVNVDIEAKTVRSKPGYYPDKFANIPADAEFESLEGMFTYKKLTKIVLAFKNVYGVDVKLRIIVGHDEMRELFKNAPGFFFYDSVEGVKFMGYTVTEMDRDSYLGVDTLGDV